MKRSSVLSFLLVFCLVIGTGVLRIHGQGRGNNPEAQARQKQQLELEAATPKLQITEEVLPLTLSKCLQTHAFKLALMGDGHDLMGLSVLAKA